MEEDVTRGGCRTVENQKDQWEEWRSEVADAVGWEQDWMEKCLAVKPGMSIRDGRER